jgi:SAM-dependent methyltransferase
MLTSREYYDRWSQDYDQALEQRASYVRSINNLVIEWSRTTGAKTILDVGCGTGSRLQQILAQTNLAGVGVDESPRMIAEARARGLAAYVLDIAAPLTAGILPHPQFDVVVALWNVLGHISGRNGRLAALRNMRSLARAGGTILFDVNNRYNAAHYGWPRAARNWIHDLVRPNDGGDFIIRRPASGPEEATWVRLFSLREVLALCREAELEPVSVRFVDYARGTIARMQWGGQICVIARASREL